MTVFLKIKALAKRKPLVERVPLTIDEPITTASALVEFIVRRNVEAYNEQAVEAPLFAYLTDEQLANGAAVGKVDFGDRKNENAQNAEEAVENALICFGDGIFRVFVNAEEAGFNQAIKLNDGDEITFIRLTMLAGRLW